MKLNKNFYKEIYEKEQMWTDMLKLNLINVYYLSKIKEFYQEKQKILNDEFKLTENNIIRSIFFALNNIIVKLDFFINEDKNGKIIRFAELKNLFLINTLGDNLPCINKERLNEMQRDKKNLYERRKQVVGEDNEDYINDDFYYNN